MTDAEKRYRASEADRLLKEPLLVEALDEIEKAAVELLLKTDGAEPEDDRLRRMLIDRVNVIRDLRTKLDSMISQGKAAARTWVPA